MSNAQFQGEAVTIGTPTSANGGLDLDLSGRPLGDYRLLRRLGRGAMADVYLAEQGSLRRQVALKILKRELAADDSYVRRFDMEAQAAASLVQANIVQIYEVGCIEGWHYIAQEYVEGQNVSQYLQRHGTLDCKMALAVLRQVTAALCKAADRGIVHRDIKPENIMLAKNGEVKVADFGLARIGAGDEVLKLTQVGITMGTPLYMSPEQVEGRTLDPRSDIYSLGVTCYHMLAGNPPFRGDTALSVALQHVRTQPERLENLRPDLPPALSRIVHKMLSKDPAERYATPRDLLHELRALKIEGVDTQWPAELDELGGVETAALGTASWAATQRLQIVMNKGRLRRNRRGLFLTLAAIAVSLVLGGALQYFHRGPFLLDVSGAEPSAEEDQGSSVAQFYYAMSRPDDVRAWQILIERYDDDFYVPMGKEELSLLYLQDLDKDSRGAAMKLFEELVKDYPIKKDMSDTDKKYHAFGLAGQAIIYALDKDPKKSAEKLLELQKLLGGNWNTADARNILDSRLATMLDKVRDLDVNLTHQRGDDKDASGLSKLLENTSTQEPTSSQSESPDSHK